MCVTVLYLSWPVVVQMYQSGEMSGNSGGLIRWPVWVALPVGFTLLLLQGWSELIKRVAFLRGVGPDPMGRLTDKSAEEELAEAIFFLCSERSSYITGQMLAVDGGFDAAGIGLPTLRGQRRNG